MTLHEHVARARERLRDAGINDVEAEIDARLLAQHVLGWDPARYFADGTTPAPPGFGARFDALVARRAAREPIPYIVGLREFWGLTFVVSPAVLIPRPETELIVEASLDMFPAADTELRVADVCTGSGCLAVALAYERPRARVIATDLSDAALRIAAENARRNGVSDRVELRSTDLLDGVDGPFDLIVSNPPYVREVDRRILQPEVREHEPAMALFGGSDGLALIRRLVPAAAARLRPGGVLLFEFGCGQDQEVEDAIAGAASLTFVELRRDLQGIPRTAVARKI